MFFCKSNIAKNDTTATREWPPACFDSNCSNMQLLKGEIFVFYCSLFEAIFHGLGAVYTVVNLVVELVHEVF